MCRRAWRPGTWTQQSAACTGRGLGVVFGDLVQFGDIKDTGGFIQTGDGFTPQWSAHAFHYISKPGTNDVTAWMGHDASGQLESQQATLTLIYSAGPCDASLDAMHDKLHSLPATWTARRSAPASYAQS